MSDWIKVNQEKLTWQYTRRKQLQRELKFDLLKRMDEIEQYADLDILALEGLEVENGLYDDLSIRLVLTRSSGRFYLEINRYHEGQEQDPAFADEKRVKGKGNGPEWIPVTVVDT